MEIIHGLSLLIVFSLIASSIVPSLKYAAPSGNPIQQIVVIVQENHSFDNYFGAYPGANGIPPNVRMPLDPQDPSRGYVSPFLTTNPVTSPDIPHYYLASHIAYNNGSMDGFMMAENEESNTMSYYDNKTISYYWDFSRTCGNFV